MGTCTVLVEKHSKKEKKKPCKWIDESEAIARLAKKEGEEVTRGNEAHRFQLILLSVSGGRHCPPG